MSYYWSNQVFSWHTTDFQFYHKSGGFIVNCLDRFGVTIRCFALWHFGPSVAISVWRSTCLRDLRLFRLILLDNFCLPLIILAILGIHVIQWWLSGVFSPFFWLSWSRICEVCFRPHGRRSVEDSHCAPHNSEHNYVSSACHVNGATTLSPGMYFRPVYSNFFACFGVYSAFVVAVK